MVISSCSLLCFFIVDEKSAAKDPGKYYTGVMHWHKNKKMDELMEFLSRYVHNVYPDCYFRNSLIYNLGCTYLDIITANNITYVI